jgi:diguanylate cyclase (GGDEF)-like protein
MDSHEKMTKRQLLAEVTRLRRRVAELEARLADPSEIEQKLKYLSTHDELTGLHNRIFFDDEMSRLGRGRQFPISVIAANVDGLKRINDREGHAVGDALLKRTALVLKEAFRADEVVARIGGDEFAVLLPRTDATTAQAVLDRVRSRLLSHNATQAGSRLNLSLGAATAKAASPLHEALRQADEQMRQEKLAHQLESLNSIPHDPQRVFEHVEARLSANPGIHLSGLASELACERHLIERSVKTVTSMPFRQYRQVRLLATALRLLGERPLLIKQISSLLGYTSPKSLWRLLRTKMGQSPSSLQALTTRTPAANTKDEMSFSTSASRGRLKQDLPRS